MNHEQVSQLQEVDELLCQGFKSKVVAASFGWTIEEMEERRKYLIESGRLTERTFEL